MSKKEQFITEVQTALIVYHISNKDEKDTGTFSVLIDMDDAFYASDRIPAEMSAHEAACLFVEFATKSASEEDYQAPVWCLREKNE